MNQISKLVKALENICLLTGSQNQIHESIWFIANDALITANQNKLSASEILKKYEDSNEMHLHDVDRKWVIEAMEEYAQKDLESYKDGWVRLPDGFKMYTCTDCQHPTILYDNNDVMVGICSKCQHPLWNEPLPTPPQTKTNA